VRPADAQDIKVLKDVSSTSVYGGAGAHGVILITTKGDR
jgi:TonB-dependent SusC/RagA subfamily outer membrane receptor